MSMIEKFASKLKRDGVDHVRISPFGETRLGKITSHDWRRKFFIPHVGEFLSPVCFANWISTGDESARHDPKYRCKDTIRGFRMYVLFAKYYQLCGMQTMIRKDKELVELPFITYKLHQSGVKEFDRWDDYASEVKAMLDHLLDPERGTAVGYDWSAYPNLLDNISFRIQEIASTDNGDDEDDVPVTDETHQESDSQSDPSSNEQNTTEPTVTEPPVTTV